ncbi:MAG: RNA polymerase sigma factor ShbA [Streptosporangiales bacterium]
MTALELEDLVPLAVDGDPRATEELLARLRPMVLRYCRARLGRVSGSYDQADDVAQEVCVAVLAALPRYRDEGKPFAALVFGIAARKVVDQRRVASRAAYPTDELPEEADWSAGPEELTLRGAEADRARALLRQLPDNLAHLLLLRVAVGFSAEETGEALDMSAGAVRVAQHRALTRLRKLVDQEPAEPAAETATVSTLDSRRGRHRADGRRRRGKGVTK